MNGSIVASQVDGRLPLVRFKQFEQFPHGISTRLGGVSDPPYESLNLGRATDDVPSRVLENQERFLRAVGATRSRTMFGCLTHGRQVSVFRQEDWISERESMGGQFRSDAIVSNVSGLFFFLTFADCVPIVVADPSRGIVGAAHAGWRGTALGIGSEVVRSMVEAFDCQASDLVAAIGPSIGPCCYAVGDAVARTFEVEGRRPTMRQESNATFLDLWATNQSQLQNAGVREESIENPRICTACNPDYFYSHRAESGTTGRFGLCIGKL